MEAPESLQKRIEYVQDVAGWKSIIFLPFVPIWQMLTMILILLVFLLTTSMLTYDLKMTIILYIIHVCDVFYFLDTLCSFLHCVLKNTRKLKNFRNRPWLFIMVDIVSLIPMELIYKVVIYSKGANAEKIEAKLVLNRCLRIYRFYYYFGQTYMQQDVRYFYVLFYVQLFLYGFLISHIAACFFQFMKTSQELQMCPNGRWDCMIVNEVNIFFLMTGRFIGNNTLYVTTEKMSTCILIISIGHFYMHGVMIPLIIFSCMKRLQGFFMFWDRFQRLKIFVEKLIENVDLKKKILEEYRMVWTYGKGDDEPELLKSFPLNMRKNAYSDIYWDALRHSELFYKVSYGCKRSLAMKFKGDFYTPGTIIWNVGETKNNMLYISSGILQIMAEENSTSPIVSFSSGTVLGEASLFFPDTCKAIIRVATYSEIHILRASDLFSVIQNYPHDREIIKRNLKLRLHIARLVQLRKQTISKIMFNRNNVGEVDDQVAEGDCIKWIKTQFRQISAMQEMYLKAVGNQLQWKHLPDLNNKINDLKMSVNHTTIYLPLLNLGEKFEILTDVTCLKTSFPWVIDPTSNFSRTWSWLINLIILAYSIIFPLYLAWFTKFPKWLDNFSHLFSLLYLLDFFLELSTAVKTQNLLIVKSGAIFRYRMRRLSFYADLLAAIPLKIIFQIALQDNFNIFYKKISVACGFVKVYKIVMFLIHWCETLNGRFSLKVMIKYLFFYCLIIYWATALLHILDVECAFGGCKTRWYKPQLENKFKHYRNLAAAFFVLKFLMDVPNRTNYEHSVPSALYILFFMILVTFVLVIWAGDFNAAYMLEKSQEVKFINIIHSVNNFLNERNISARVKKRVFDNIHFQWHYDCGDYLTQERAMLDDAPTKLKKEVDKLTVFQALKNCNIFQKESDSLIWFLCEKSYKMALPSNSVILTYGIQSMALYVIYRGYLQLNSFLPNDISDGLATSTNYGPGTILPIVVALNQVPSVVTARAQTDCELIVISLEDFLRGLIFDNCFKDFVEAIKNVDIEPFRKAVLTISVVSKPVSNVREHYKTPFAKLGFCGLLLKQFFMTKPINSQSKLFVCWEIFRLISLITAAVSWPIYLCHKTIDHRLEIIYVLLVLESCCWIDFYIKFHIGFYNKKGIYISHPISTSWHYLTTSFVLDLINIIPYLHSIIIIVRDPGFNASFVEIIVHSSLRMFGLIRIALFIKHLQGVSDFIYRIKIIGLFFLLMIILHCFSVIKVNEEIIVTINPNGTETLTLKDGSWIKSLDIPSLDTRPKMYFVLLYCVIMVFTRNFPAFDGYTPDVLMWSILFSSVGLVVILSLKAFMVTRSAGSKMNFTIYQYHMKSLTDFLKSERADDLISTIAVKHFEHEWEKKKGEELNIIFSRFPNILEEDLKCPIYKKTLQQVICFKNANEAFYRAISRMFTEIHFRKGSIILFEKGVHRDIYFIHSGKCYVKDDNVTLTRGSVMGDIKGKGISNSTILARTHLVLLGIKSPDFFVLLNNFYYTEAAFFDEVKHVKDYLPSHHIHEEEEEIPEIFIWKDMNQERPECEFEPLRDLKEPTHSVGKEKQKRHFLSVIDPRLPAIRILRLIFLLDAVLTAFVIPIVIGLHLATLDTIMIIYFLDIIWMIKIAVRLRIGYIDPDTGNVVTNPRDIFKNYLKSVDGLIVHILAVIPFELVYDLILYFNSKWNKGIRRYCYVLRLLRLLSFYIKIGKEKKKLSLRISTRLIIIMLQQFISFIFLVAINMIISSDDRLRVDNIVKNYTREVIEAFILGCFSVINVYCGAGLYLFPPKSLLEVGFRISISIISVYETAMLSSHILTIINTTSYVRSEKLLKMQRMSDYLTARDVSPALKKHLVNYACDLLEYYRTDVTPWFIQTAPYYIKVEIMQDLYIQHLLNCYPFEGLQLDFLKQLAARLDRQVYFPKEIIAEKGDVDSRMYFIHRGEVHAIEEDSIYQGLYYETRSYSRGSSFGIEQGLSRSVPHTTTFRATSKADLLSLNFFDWEDLRRAFPDVKVIIQKNMSKKRANT